MEYKQNKRPFDRSSTDHPRVSVAAARTIFTKGVMGIIVGDDSARMAEKHPPASGQISVRCGLDGLLQAVISSVGRECQLIS